jgi:hypothetical protein
MSAAGPPQGTRPPGGERRAAPIGGDHTRAACAAASFGACLLLCAGTAAACGEELRGATRTIDGKSYVVVFTTVPEPIAVGAHFALDFAVCPRAKAEAPRDVRVDANMPEHRHGMNYRPVVTTRPSGAYHAEGLMFHMPGRWDLTFDVVTASGATERLTGTMQLQ